MTFWRAFAPCCWCRVHKWNSNRVFLCFRSQQMLITNTDSVALRFLCLCAWCTSVLLCCFVAAVSHRNTENSCQILIRSCGMNHVSDVRPADTDMMPSEQKNDALWIYCWCYYDGRGLTCTWGLLRSACVDVIVMYC